MSLGRELTKDDIGKRFRQRDGSIVSLVDHDTGRIPFRSNAGHWYSENGKTAGETKAWELVECLDDKQEPAVNATPEQINKAIDGMDALCTKGREQVKGLIETLFGVELKNPVPQAGEVWRYTSSGSLYLIVNSGTIMKLDNGKVFGNGTLLDAIYADKPVKAGWTKVAENLDDYTANL